MAIGGSIGTAHITLRATMEQYERDLNRARAETQRAAGQMAASLSRVERATDRLNQSAHRTGFSLQRLSRQFLVLNAAISALPVALGIRGAVRMADAYQNMQARIAQTTATTEEAVVVQQRLFDIAQNARTPLEALTETYVRLRLATAELGLSQEASLVVTESLSKLLALSGSTAEEAEGAFRQLTQSFTRGELRGQELASVYEQFPILLRIVARESGTTTSALLGDALQNGLAVDKIINSLISAQGQIDEQFQKLPVTIGQAFTRVENSLTRAIGITSKAGQAYDALVETLDDLRKTVDDPGFQRGLIAIFQVIAFIVKDLASGIQRLGAMADIISRLAEGDIGGIWERYLTQGKAAEEQADAVAEAVNGIASEGEDVSDIIEDLTEAMRDLRNEAVIASLGAFQFAGALDMIRVAFSGQDVGNIAPESVINAMQELADAGFDVTRSFSDWPATLQESFRSLVQEEEALRRVNVQMEAQSERLDALKEAHLEYQKSRGQSTDAAIAKGEEDFERWQEQQEEFRQNLIDARDIFAREVASGWVDAITGAETFGDAIANITQRLIEAALQAAAFAAITAAIGAPGAAGAPGTGLFGLLGFAHGGVIQGGVKRMAAGGFITNRPMITPMATGAALIGEAGPEAVLPLRRTASGDLGVASEGGGGGGGDVIVYAPGSDPGTIAAAFNRGQAAMQTGIFQQMGRSSALRQQLGNKKPY